MATSASTPLTRPAALLPASSAAASGAFSPKARKPTWLRQPQRTLGRKVFFQLHLWSGLLLGFYIVVVCVSGSALVFRTDVYDLIEKWIREGKASNQDFAIRTIYEVFRWFGDLHGRLLLGPRGIVVNAIGGFLTCAVCVTGLVLWWPGIARWRGALTLRSDVGWKRLNFDMHSAFGIWTFLILFMWGITGGYFVFPEPFRAVINVFTPVDPPGPPPQRTASVRAGAVTGSAVSPAAASGSVSASAGVRQPARGPFPRRRRPYTTGGKILRAFSFAHYGNFAGWKVKTLWTLLGFAPVVLFGTALLMWWNRVLAPMWRRLGRERQQVDRGELCA